MMGTLAVKTETRLARPLKTLIPLIQQDIEKAEESGLEF